MFKNVSGQMIGAEMINSTSGNTFAGTVTVYITGDTASQTLGASASGVCTHKGNGFFTYLPTQAETNFDLIAFTFIGDGAIATTIQVPTKPSLNEIADATLKRDYSSVTGEATYSLINNTRFPRNKWEITNSNVLNVYKENESTVAWTSTLSTTTSASQVTGADPS